MAELRQKSLTQAGVSTYCAPSKGTDSSSTIAWIVAGVRAAGSDRVPRLLQRPSNAHRSQRTQPPYPRGSTVLDEPLKRLYTPKGRLRVGSTVVISGARGGEDRRAEWCQEQPNPQHSYEVGETHGKVV